MSSFIKLNITTDANTERGYILNKHETFTFGKFGVIPTIDDGSGNNVGAWFDALGNATGINYGVAGYASGTNGENRGVLGRLILEPLIGQATLPIEMLK